MTVIFNTDSLSAGCYDAAIEISSNDPLNRIIRVPVHLRVDPGTGIDNTTNQIPKQYALFQNYPNPFNPTTVIEYELPRQGHIRLAVNDVLGRHIHTLVDTQQPAGHFRTIWDGTDEHNVKMAAGVYFCRLEAGDPSTSSGHSFVKVIKLALVK